MRRKTVAEAAAELRDRILVQDFVDEDGEVSQCIFLILSVREETIPSWSAKSWSAKPWRIKLITEEGQFDELACDDEQLEKVALHTLNAGMITWRCV